MGGKESMKLLYKILIAIGISLLLYLGGFICGRISIEKYPTEYTRQLGIELESSLESNRQIREYYSQFEEENKRFRDATTKLVDGIGYDVEELEDGIIITRKLIEQCLEFVQELREIDREIEEEK